MHHGAWAWAAAATTVVLVAVIHPGHGSGVDTAHLVQTGQRAMEAGNFAAAVTALRQAAAADGSDPYVWSDLAMAYAEQGQLAASAEALERCAEVVPSRGVWQVHYNLGYTRQRLADFPAALAAFEAAVDTAPSPVDAVQPRIKAAFILQASGDPLAAIDHLQAALAAVPGGDPELYGYLGDTLNNVKHWPQAVAAYEAGLALAPRHVELRFKLGETLLNTGHVRAAAKHFKAALRRNPRHGGLLAARLFALRRLAYWHQDDDTLQRAVKGATTALAHGDPSPLSPYQSLFVRLPPHVRAGIAASWGRQYAQQAAQLGWVRRPPPPRPPPDAVTPLRAVFLSRRFERYPGTQLMVATFAHYDRQQLHATCMATGADDGSDERAALRLDCHAMEEVGPVAADHVADQIVTVGTDVVIDYDGLHDFNNQLALALRPAELQLSWLGFAATQGGGGAVDALVVDGIVAAPETSAAVFAEPLVLLPTATCQPQSPLERFAPLPAALSEWHAHPATSHDAMPALSEWRAAVAPLRQAAGLPVDAVVLACMNRAHKLDPITFDVWMNVLRRVPATVLWLYAPDNDTQPFIVAAAAARGVPAHRIVFMAKVPKDEHLVRHYAADLFLDTLEYGAHTTAADALSTALPVVTVQGASFASRVASSLLLAVGHRSADALVAHSVHDMEAIAVRLVSSPSMLLALRRQLAATLFPRGRRAAPDAPCTTRQLFRPSCFAEGMTAAVRAAWSARIATQPAVVEPTPPRLPHVVSHTSWSRPAIM